MTICIAALYENGKGCVLASDQMVTAHFPIGYEFESDEVDKIVNVCSAAPIHTLIAGDVFFANNILEMAKKEAEVKGISTTPGIAELVRKSYQTVRRNVIIHTQLESRGLDINTYYNSHQRLLPQIVQIIDNMFATYSAKVDLIVAGMGESKCNIYTITNPGQIVCNDPIGYSAIGTGAPHAIYSLIESNYKKSLSKKEVEELVTKAKERSEVAPGVGKKTKIISPPM